MKKIEDIVMDGLVDTKLIIDIKHNLMDALNERERQITEKAFLAGCRLSEYQTTIDNPYVKWIGEIPKCFVDWFDEINELIL